MRNDSCNRHLIRTRLLALLVFEFVVWVTRRFVFVVLLKTLQLSEAPQVQVMFILATLPVQVMSIFVFQVLKVLVIQTSTTWVILNGHQLRPKNRSET